MRSDKIVLITCVCDQVDILREFIEWYLHLGVDSIVIQDSGSKDGSLDLLDQYARSGKITWFPLPERNMQKYDSRVELPTLARDRFNAEWIIFADTDEFLCPQGDNLRQILARAKKDEFTVLSVPRHGMTGAPLNSGEQPLEMLTLRIDREVDGTFEQLCGGNLPAPYMFMHQGPKAIVRAPALVEYTGGAHAATAAWGKNGAFPGLRFLHYPVRGFDTFQAKVRNAAAWLRDNPHLDPGWGWQWRRWVRLNQEGGLREDYENQFVTPAQAQDLIRDGACSVDETISNWVKQASTRGLARRLIRRLGFGRRH